jgi:neutral ceramidase
VICGYANAYSGYVTTPEEYDLQHYEGASTLYGPHTLAAYRQTFGMLATAARNNAPAPGWLPFKPPAITRRAA